ncbi:hypothetical protein I6L27_01870 [Acinetobacter pittii]|uniref:hypothetical protein n=1 Tax=Acinetobacter pittii TaxID=48296 RepID=UPI001C223112|nr:hypothetical protein [Acinetobacter pittii]QXA07959.1 hypothetical protein I6L27_19220 [Acinetobacter pittii]QXA08313.1 hypothetical protein I6L27_01870 [Acinetobacter pittii]
MDKCIEEFLKQHSPKVLKIVKFDDSKNGFVLHDHLDLTDINLSALAEINYGWSLWQHQQAKVEELQNRLDKALEVIMEYYTGSYEESPDLVVDLEQALKGEV